jgi:hypothetical protein
MKGSTIVDLLESILWKEYDRRIITDSSYIKGYCTDRD